MPPGDLATRISVLEAENRLYREQAAATNQRIEKKLDEHIAKYELDRKGDKTTRVSLMIALITTSGTVLAAAFALLGSSPT